MTTAEQATIGLITTTSVSVDGKYTYLNLHAD